MEHDLTVYLVLYDRHSLAVSRKLFTSVEEYIDDHYVAQNDESYQFDRRRRESAERRRRLEEDTALAFAVGLHLSEDETIDLLKSAGYAFSDGSKRDWIVRYCLEQKFITSIRSTPFCSNGIRNSWVRDLSPAR